MSTTSQWAAAVAADIGRLVNGEMSQADFTLAMTAATRDWTVSTSDIQELARQVSSFLVRLNSFDVIEGAPSDADGGLGSWIMNRLTGEVYGPKTPAGWGPPAFSLVGPSGASAKAVVIAAALLPPDATDADFAEWLADSQIAKVQPLLDDAQAAATQAGEQATEANAARVAAEAAATAAGDHADAAAGDAQATAADRVATGEDRGAVAADRAAAESAATTATDASDAATAAAGVAGQAASDAGEAAGASVSAANAATDSASAAHDDAQATAADRQAVAEDKAAVAADRVASETAAQTATDKAGEASSSATDAGAAKTAAEAAQAAAEQARDEAEAIAGGEFVTGPVSSTVGRLAAFGGTNGRSIVEGPEIGVGADGHLLRRSDGDARYRRVGAVPIADVTGLEDALDGIGQALAGKPDASAVNAALQALDDAKQDSLGFTPADAADTYTKEEVDAAFDALPEPPEVPAKATGADLRAGTDDAKYLTAKAVSDAAAYVTTPWAASLVLDLSIPAQVVVLGGNTTISIANARPGVTARVLLKQPASGGPRTVAYAASIKFFGAVPSASTAANAVDMLVLDPETATTARAVLQKGGAA